MKGAFRHWKKVAVDDVYNSSNAPFMLRKQRPPPIASVRTSVTSDVHLRLPVISKELPQPKPTVYVPVINIDAYICDLEKQDPVRAKEILKEHTGVVVGDRPRKIPWYPPRGIHESIIRLNTMYYSKGVKPPIEERVMAFREAGYPDWYLVEMLKKDHKAKENEDALGEFIYTVFGNMDNKKVTAPKKRTLKQILNIKGGVVPVRMEDDCVI